MVHWHDRDDNDLWVPRQPAPGADQPRNDSLCQEKSRGMHHFLQTVRVNGRDLHRRHGDQPRHDVDGNRACRHHRPVQVQCGVHSKRTVGALLRFRLQRFFRRHRRRYGSKPDFAERRFSNHSQVHDPSGCRLKHSAHRQIRIQN